MLLTGSKPHADAPQRFYPHDKNQVTMGIVANITFLVQSWRKMGFCRISECPSKERRNARKMYRGNPLPLVYMGHMY